MTESSHVSKTELLELRSKYIAANVALNYSKANGLVVMRGERQYLYDEVRKVYPVGLSLD